MTKSIFFIGVSALILLLGGVIYIANEGGFEMGRAKPSGKFETQESSLRGELQDAAESRSPIIDTVVRVLTITPDRASMPVGGSVVFAVTKNGRNPGRGLTAQLTPQIGTASVQSGCFLFFCRGEATITYRAPSSLPQGQTGIDVALTATHGDERANAYIRVGAPPSPVNTAPSVNAGPDQTITLPSSATMNGTVSDDGLPNPPGRVEISWRKVSGPGSVEFEYPNTASGVDKLRPKVFFSSAGHYVLELTANDSALSSSDSVTVTVNARVNTAPSVNAGPDQTITLPSSATMNGTVSDDGLPNPPGRVEISWRKVSGPGSVEFEYPNTASGVDKLRPKVFFSSAGHYVLELTANDSALSSSDSVTVTVNARGGSKSTDSMVPATDPIASVATARTCSVTPSAFTIAALSPDIPISQRPQYYTTVPLTATLSPRPSESDSVYIDVGNVPQYFLAGILTSGSRHDLLVSSLVTGTYTIPLTYRISPTNNLRVITETGSCGSVQVTVLPREARVACSLSPRFMSGPIGGTAVQDFSVSFAPPFPPAANTVLYTADWAGEFSNVNHPTVTTLAPDRMRMSAQVPRELVGSMGTSGGTVQPDQTFIIYVGFTASDAGGAPLIRGGCGTVTLKATAP